MLEAQGGGDSLTDQNGRCPKGNYEVVLNAEMGRGAFSIYCDSSWSLNCVALFSVSSPCDTTFEEKDHYKLSKVHW